jgi:hypothetical protein
MQGATSAPLHGYDASHRAINEDTHRTHWPAADFPVALRVRSGVATAILTLFGRISARRKSANRKLVEVSQ